ncbi:hypothetical protein B0H14DRAFT_2849045 [Mycena olivaceomarginata]|nr:hypothetical protein B0H14DRAFT_2849045 [Mycena olivaceomarginata]
MFKRAVTAFLATLSLSSLASATMIPDLVFHNGQNITFDYHDSIVPASNLFGMGVTSDGWEGPVVLNMDDMDEIPATYVCNIRSSRMGLFTVSAQIDSALNILNGRVQLPKSSNTTRLPLRSLFPTFTTRLSSGSTFLARMFKPGVTCANNLL